MKRSHAALCATLAFTTLAASGEPAHALGGSRKVPAELTAYTPLDPASAAALAKLSDIQWEHVKALPNPLHEQAPRLYPMHLTWQNQVTVGVSADGKMLHFENPFFTAIEAHPGGEGGGGYADPIPILKSGVRRLKDGVFEFMFWAAFHGAADPDENRLRMKVPKPYVLQALDFSEVTEARRKDPTCSATELQHGGSYACTSAKTAFNYLLLRFDPSRSDQLELSGRIFGAAEPAFTLQMRPSLPFAEVGLTLDVLLERPAADPIVTKIGSGITNFHAVVPGKIYRGARPGNAGMKALAEAGIRSDINLQGGDRIMGIPVEDGESDEDIAEEGELARTHGIQFISKPLSAISPRTSRQEEQIDEVLELLDESRNHPVYFHCRHGADRTGLVAALYRVLHQGCTPAQAHAEMMKYGHSRLLPWLDRYFKKRVARDPRTRFAQPAPECPL